MILKFINNDNDSYFIDSKNLVIRKNKIFIYQNDIPALNSGFKIYDDDKNLLYNCENYTVIYKHTDQQIAFTSDKNIYSVYYIYNKDNYITSYMITSSSNITRDDVIFIRKGQGSFFDNVELDEIIDFEGLPKFKIVNNIIISVTDKDKQVLREKKLSAAKRNKIELLSKYCEQNIIAGIDYKDKHFSYEITDQNNLYNAVQLALSTGLAAPFHADGETCELYSLEDIVSIYIKQQTNLTHNSTYYNQLKLFVNSLTDINMVNGVYYGQELIGEFLDKYNEIMTQAKLIINSFTGQKNILINLDV